MLPFIRQISMRHCVLSEILLRAPVCVSRTVPIPVTVLEMLPGSTLIGVSKLYSYR